MNKEIKFRAWDKIHKQMVCVHKINYSADCKKDSNPIEIEVFGGGDYFWLLPVCFELCAFTGLKDKNGKEIYEGDIVMFLFDSGCGEEENFAEIVNYSKTHIMWGCQLLDPLGVEIIGNIYENKELLK